jgi:hypothetical protein
MLVMCWRTCTSHETSFHCTFSKSISYFKRVLWICAIQLQPFTSVSWETNAAKRWRKKISKASVEVAVEVHPVAIFPFSKPMSIIVVTISCALLLYHEISSFRFASDLLCPILCRNSLLLFIRRYCQLNGSIYCDITQCSPSWVNYISKRLVASIFRVRK